LFKSCFDFHNIKVCVDFISNLLEMHLTLLNIWFSFCRQLFY
jgi:hypothetical protein